MQDFNYDFTNAMELTIEVSCCKYPDRKRLLTEWENNFKSLIAYIEQAQRGVRGFVRDGQDKPLKGAEIQVKDISKNSWIQKNVTTDIKGRYWKILLPGEYEVKAVYENKESKSEKITISEEQNHTRRDFVLNIEDVKSVPSTEINIRNDSPITNDFEGTEIATENQNEQETSTKHVPTSTRFPERSTESNQEKENENPNRSPGIQNLLTKVLKENDNLDDKQSENRKPLLDSIFKNSGNSVTFPESNEQRQPRPSRGVIFKFIHGKRK